MTDFAIMRIWSEEDANSVNPIVLDDIMEEDVEKLVEEGPATQDQLDCMRFKAVWSAGRVHIIADAFSNSIVCL